MKFNSFEKPANNSKESLLSKLRGNTTKVAAFLALSFFGISKSHGAESPKNDQMNNMSEAATSVSAKEDSKLDENTIDIKQALYDLETKRDEDLSNYKKMMEDYSLALADAGHYLKNKGKDKDAEKLSKMSREMHSNIINYVKEAVDNEVKKWGSVKDIPEKIKEKIADNISSADNKYTGDEMLYIANLLNDQNVFPVKGNPNLREFKNMQKYSDQRGTSMNMNEMDVRSKIQELPKKAVLEYIGMLQSSEQLAKLQKQNEQVAEAN